MTTTNPLESLIASIVRAEVREAFASLGLALPDAEPTTKPAEPAAQRRSTLPLRIVEQPTERPQLTRRAAPQRTATPAHYRPTRFASTVAGGKLVASLTPRLANTFKAIARRKNGMARPDVSGATETSPKQAENNIYGLQKLELVETFYPDAR